MSSISNMYLGICDRCGLQYKKVTLKKEWTNKVVCESCYEEKHPQLEPRHKDLGDPKPLRDPRNNAPIQTSSNAAYTAAFPHTAGGRP